MYKTTTQKLSLILSLAPDPAINNTRLFSASVFPFSPHSSLIWAGDYGPTLQIRKARYQKSPQDSHSVGREWSLGSNSGLGKLVTALWITPCSLKPVFPIPKPAPLCLRSSLSCPVARSLCRSWARG